MTEKATVKILRSDPLSNREPGYETFEVPFEAGAGLKVAAVLRYIYENLDPSLSFRETCNQSYCGACLVRVNNRNVLACDALAEKEMIIEPAGNHKVLKDLIVELSREEGGAVESQ
jgi:succinate dehydrogenase / fumarate reductase, iron-sulfur subunit